MAQEIVQHYGKDENGNTVLLSQETVEVQGPSIEDKEAELLALYDEIQAMKAAQNA